MFTQDTTSFDGKWFQVTEALNRPRPIQPGGPPVLIGGSGERKTLRMVAQYADACNVFGDAAQVRHLMGVLDGHCERLGRDPRSICRTRLGTLVLGETMEAAQTKILGRFGVSRMDDLPPDLLARVRGMFLLGDPDAVGEQIGELLDAGLDGLVFNMPDAHDLDAVAFAGSVLAPLLLD